MHVLAIRRPGQRGTQKLVTRYGDRLVCVRYRYDAAAGKRYKTVEIILDEAAWTPPPPHPDAPRQVPKMDHIDDLDAQPEHREVGVKVFFRENELRERVKAAGAAGPKSISCGRCLMKRPWPWVWNIESRGGNGSRYGNMFTDIETWF